MCFHTVQVEQLLTSCRCEANVHCIYKRKRQEERGLLSDQSSLVEERHTEVVYFSLGLSVTVAWAVITPSCIGCRKQIRRIYVYKSTNLTLV